MWKAFKFRLYPSRAQRQVLERTLDTCRMLYNDALAERKEAWEKEHRSISLYEQKRELPELKHSNSYLLKVHAHVLQDALIRLDKSFKNYFYRRARNGEKPGYPRFKGKNRYDSFTYFEYGNGAKIRDRKLWLSKIGEINIKLHRELPSGAMIKTCTICRDVDRWYACFSVELPDAAPEEHKIESAVGVDVGLESLVTLSNGVKIEPPKFLHRSEEKLAREQRGLVRKQRGSRNRNKQRIRVAKVHRKIRLQRSDFLHKLSRQLVDDYDLIAFEDLRVKNMLGNHYLARSIADASWSRLQAYTAYKAAEAGKHVVLVEPNGTTQECSNCGATMQLGLADRTFRCIRCGLAMDRDHNAAINILKRVGWDAAEYTPVETGVPLTTRESSPSLKQEAPDLVWGGRHKTHQGRRAYSRTVPRVVIKNKKYMANLLYSPSRFSPCT